LAFKILAAGRRCVSQEMVRDAFQFAFRHIKPGDGVIVGMYPRRFDQVRANQFSEQRRRDMATRSTLSRLRNRKSDLK